MKWRRRREQQAEVAQEAERVADEVADLEVDLELRKRLTEQSMVKAAGIRGRAEAVAERLRQHRTDNHLAEALERDMRGRL